MRSRIAIWLLLLPLFFAASLPAQQRLATLTKGKLTAVLDTYSGRFSAKTVNGAQLLFARDAELTSHISVALDGEIYTNYPKSDMNVLWPLHALGRGETQVLADRIRHTWRLGSRRGERRVILELEPVSDSLYNEVRVHLIVENATMDAISTGMTVMEDVCAGPDDKVRLRNGATPLEYERRFDATELPERLMLMSGGYVPDSAYCRLRGDGLTTPDAVTVGRWMYHSALGTAVYGYEATGLPIWDTAVLAQWNSTNLLPGQHHAVSTAVGLTGSEPETPATGTFAKEFRVPVLSSVLLSLVCESTASATITTPYCDNAYESATTADRYWDTTVTISRQNPVTLVVSLRSLRPEDTDSITYYRQSYTVVQADREIGLSIREFGDNYNLDGDMVWPSNMWDTQYLYHGMMGQCAFGVFMDARADSIRITNSLEYFIAGFSARPPGGYLVGGSISVALPPKSRLRFDCHNGVTLYNHWSPKRPSDRTLSIDGTGDIFKGENKFLLVNRFSQYLHPGGRLGPGQSPYWQFRYLHQPSSALLGMEYVFVPFFKPHATRQDDLIRIVAYHDGTEVRLDEATPPIMLDRAQSIDTLLSTATVISTNNPVAVYQHHLSCYYLQSDTVYAGGAFALLQREIWGKRYHVWTGDLFASNMGYTYPWWTRPGDAPYYDNLYLIVVTLASNRAGVLVNDVPVDAGRFKVFGDYAYAYIDISPGYLIVSSKRPLLTVVCGGGGSTRYRKETPFGMSWIPPFTSSPSGGGPIVPKHDEREGKRDTYIPRD